MLVPVLPWALLTWLTTEFFPYPHPLPPQKIPTNILWYNRFLLRAQALLPISLCLCVCLSLCLSLAPPFPLHLSSVSLSVCLSLPCSPGQPWLEAWGKWGSRPCPEARAPEGEVLSYVGQRRSGVEGTFPPEEREGLRITVPQPLCVLPSAGWQVQLQGCGAGLPQGWGKCLRPADIRRRHQGSAQVTSAS